MARRARRYRRRRVGSEGRALPEAFAGPQADRRIKKVAEVAHHGESRLVLLGNGAVRHPDFAAIHAAAQWIADATGATLGFLTEAANTVGAHLVNALPGEGGLNAREVFEQPRKGYVLLNVEPEFDTANPAQALAALNQAEMVVVMSPFQTGADLRRRAAADRAVHGNGRHVRQRRRHGADVQRRRASARRHASGMEGVARAGQPAGSAGLRIRHVRRSAHGSAWATAN